MRSEPAPIPVAPADLFIREVVAGDASVLADYTAVVNVTDRELNPDDPPIGTEEMAGHVFATTPLTHSRAWVATLDGEPVAETSFDLESLEENHHIAGGDSLSVVPDQRRRGIGSAILAHALDALIDDGRSTLMLWPPLVGDEPGVAFATGLGLTPALAERCSRLTTATVDDGVIDAWLAEATDRTDGYRLAQWVGPIPDEHLERMVAAHVAMEDMPIDDLDWTIPTMTADELRAIEANAVAKGLVAVTSLAIAPDGSAAGFSDLRLNRFRPTLGWQGDTGVSADHRGHGLGRWLKAANLRLAQEQQPDLAVVETYNAQSNPWMLDINVAMGFRPHLAYQAFQGDAVAARDACRR